MLLNNTFLIGLKFFIIEIQGVVLILFTNHPIYVFLHVVMPEVRFFI